MCPMPASADTGELHVVTGAFGYTGHAITRRLLSLGKRVRTLVRNPQRPNPFGDRVSVAPYRFDNLTALVRSLQGAAVFYNTYWVRFAHGRVTFDQAVAHTKMLIQACAAAGVPRIVHLSVTAAAENSPFPYFRGKGVLERAIKESALSYAILRSPLIFGPGDVLVNNIAWFLRRAPVFTIMGDGRYRLQCVHVDDVAEVAVHVGERGENVVMDVVGPETFTFDGFVRLIADRVRSRARIIHLPADIVLGLLAIAGIVVHDVVLTRDEVAALTAELLVSRGAPAGRTRFTDWLDEHAPDLGRTYASELDRHYR
jgi:uncharacterized protein YbjT (DUF2867 family)